MGDDGPTAFFRRRPDLAAFAGLFLLAILIRLWPMLAVQQSWEDAYYYIELARSLSHGRWELLGDFHAKYLPGYPAAVLVMHTMLLGIVDWFKSAQLVSAIASASIPGLCCLLTFDITGDRRAGIAAGLMAAFNSHLVKYGGMPFSEALFTCQVMLALVLARRAPVAGGFIAGWAAVTRHHGWFLVAAYAVSLLSGDDRRRRMTAFLIAVSAGAAWWLLSYYETGQWLYEIYTEESAERAPTMGRMGPGFLLLSFPVAGHLVTLFAIAGLLKVMRERAAWPAMAFFIMICAIQGWWMFRVERYFVPLVPIVCVIAGCGLWWLERALLPAKYISMRWRGLVVPGLGLLAGALHFAGFAPAMVHEESIRTSGYLKAIEHVAQKPDDFSVMAYDAFMAGYHDPRHRVIPSALLPADSWGHAIPGFFIEKKLRYIIWSDLYPADREKAELSEFEELVMPGEAKIDGKTKQIKILLVPEKRIFWIYERPARGWLRPWRVELSREAKAHIFRLELLTQ
jgi:hypothetical protein